MRIQSIVLASFASLAFAAQAEAFSQDDKTLNSPQQAERFSDPDEKTPSGAVYLQNGAVNAGAVDPSTVRYDYDATSGSFVPHRR